jgi:hypothetical protein
VSCPSKALWPAGGRESELQEEGAHEVHTAVQRHIRMKSVRASGVGTSPAHTEWRFLGVNRQPREILLYCTLYPATPTAEMLYFTFLIIQGPYLMFDCNY